MTVIPLRGNTCEKTRRHLDAYISNELSMELRQGVSKHLGECVACSELFKARLQLKNHLKQTVNSEPVPGAVRERIQAALRKEGSAVESRSPWSRWPLAAAAGLLLALSGVGTLQLWKSLRTSGEITLTAQDLTLSEQAAAVLKIGISDHIHCVIESHADKRLLSAEQMAEKLGQSYAGLVPALKTELPEGFFISLGHRCSVNGRKFVHLVLKNDTKVASLIITDKNGVNFPNSGPRTSTVIAEGITLHQDRLESLEAVGFQSKDHLAFIVSSLEHNENLQIATRIAPSVNRFLEQL